MREERKIRVKLAAPQWLLNEQVLSHGEMQSYLADLPARASEATIRQRVEQLRCPYHRRAARLIAGRGPGGQLVFAVQTCCADFNELIGWRLRYESPPEAGGASHN